MEFDLKELLRTEPEHFKLGRKMARMLRDRFGADAEAKLPDCRAVAAASGDRLQADTVRMAEKFLIGMERSQ